MLLEIPLSIAFLGLAGVLVWRSLVAIKRNAREIGQGPGADALHGLHEAISELREEMESLRADLQDQRNSAKPLSAWTSLSASLPRSASVLRCHRAPALEPHVCEQPG